MTVVGLSTVQPNPRMPYHLELPKKSLPMLGRYQKKSTWLKGDMIYTVGFHRLDLIHLGRDKTTKKRKYFYDRLGRDQMKLVYGCVLESLNMHHLVEHI